MQGEISATEGQLEPKLSVEVVRPQPQNFLNKQVLIIEEFEHSLPQVRTGLEKEGGVGMFIFGLKLPWIFHLCQYAHSKFFWKI